MSTVVLRPYQKDCVEAIKSNYQKGNNRQLISMATGSGKTVVFSELIRQMGSRALVIAHTNELLEQARDKISMIAPELKVGLLNANSKEFDTHVLVSSIQSARQPGNLEELTNQEFKLLIYDECHHATSDSSRNVLNELGFGKGTDKLLCGFTATAFRQDGKGLGEVFDVVSYEKNIKDMISEGYLCSVRGIKISTDIDLSLVKLADGGDFQAESLAQIMDVYELRQLVVDSYLKEGEGRQTICFGVTVQHAFNLAELFKKHGIPAEAIHGGTPRDEREAILNRYRKGQIKILCNCQVLTEGFDAPETSCSIIARPTQSRGLYQQMVGRGLRLFPNKRDCLILDLCTKHHSLCCAATLLEDAEVEHNKEKEDKGRQAEIKTQLPENLNQKLKSALLNFDPLGEVFTWTQTEGVFVLKGKNSRLGIVPTGNDRYKVVMASEKENRTISDGLNFEYAFATAEDFAKSNRSHFVVSDRQAPWRDLPASEKQIALIRSRGYRAGLDGLTRGQASDLIASGALKRTG